MRKDSTTAKLTDFEIQRNKLIAKIRYIACPVAFHGRYLRSTNNERLI
jgi:hypothetical protein